MSSKSSSESSPEKDDKKIISEIVDGILKDIVDFPLEPSIHQIDRSPIEVSSTKDCSFKSISKRQKKKQAKKRNELTKLKRKSCIPCPVKYKPQMAKIDAKKSTLEETKMQQSSSKIHETDTLKLEELYSRISACINFTDPRKIIIEGPKLSGKSTAAKYIINRILQISPLVYYMETDPAQCEFHLPGALSLVPIRQPIEGPSSSHQITPLKMTFLGTMDPNYAPKALMKRTKEVVDYYKTHCSKACVVVNTIGNCLTGLGYVFSQDLKKHLDPDVVITTKSKMSITLPEDKVGPVKIGLQLDLKATSLSKTEFSASQLREIIVQAYFMKASKNQKSLSQVEPYEVSWKELAIQIYNARVPKDKFVDALLGNLVALCHVDPKFILPPLNEDCPKTLENDAGNECLGFGFIRCLEKDRKVLQIVSPLEIDQLSEVNMIAAGKIPLPKSVLCMQGGATSHFLEEETA